MARSFTNIMGVQFGPIKEFKGREGFGCSMDVFLNGLLVGTFRDQASGGELEFDLVYPQGRKYFPNKKSVTDEEIWKWRKNTLNILTKISKKYLKDCTPSEKYCDIFMDESYLYDDSSDESFITEFCSSYRNSLGLIEKDLKKFIKKNETDLVVCIVQPNYAFIGDTKFVESFLPIFSTKDYSMTNEDIKKKYKKISPNCVVLRIDDFIIEAGDLNA